MSSCNDELLNELLPFYKTGRLTAEQERKISSALAVDLILQQEYARILEIRQYYQEMEAEDPALRSDIFERIKQSTLQDNSVSPTEKKFDEKISRLKIFLQNFFSSYRLAWSIAALQGVLIVVLASNVYLPSYITLSIPSNPANERLINLVFFDSTTEVEIRRLLREVNAEIVGGPTETGLYTIQINIDSSLENTLKFFQNQPQIRLAEKRV